MALLDSGCTKTVCGETWLKFYMDTLTTDDTALIVTEPSNAVFKFGDSKMIKSKKRVKIPAIIANMPVMISTDVIEYDIPLLLSKDSMKKANTQIDFKDDKVHIFGQKVDLFFSSSGHYCIPITKGCDQLSNVQVTLICTNSNTLKNKESVARKLHIQFSHPRSEKIKALLRDAEIDDKELEQHLDDLDISCEVCMKYKKPKPRPIVGLPMARNFNETVAMDLKQWSSSPNIWFLHLIDHATRYSVSCVIHSKKKEVIVRKLFEHWITTFGCAEKFLVDNGGEFCNDEFITFCENMNIRICTTAAESPWSNGLVERHNAVLGLTVSKTMEDIKCDLNLAVAWAISAKNSLKNVHGYSPNQLVFGKNPNYPSVCDNKIPALEGKTSSKVVAENLNAMHAARQGFIKSESSDKIRRALKHQTRTHSDVHYSNGDLVYYKRNDCETWKGRGSVIGQDGQRILIKHGSSYVRVHSCRLQMVERNGVNVLDRDKDVQNKELERNVDLPKIQSMNIEASDSDNDDDYNVSLNNGILPEVNENNTESSVQNEDNEVVENDHDSIQVHQEGGEDVTFDANQAVNHSNEEHEEQGCHDSSVRPKLNQFADCQLTDSNNWKHFQILSRAGKAKGKYDSWYNVRDVENGTVDCVDWNNIHKWKPHTEHEEILMSIEGIDEKDLMQAKVEELNKWKQNNVYETVKFSGQSCVSVRWVTTTKFVNGKRKVKSRFVARGFEEKDDDFLSDSPTCAKESLRIALSIIASKKWKCQSIDIKAAFLQGRPIEREVYITPPSEAGVSPHFVWKLKTCIYGLKDASKTWYLSVKEKFIELGAKPSRYDPAVFIWHQNGALKGILCAHVDDFLFGGTQEFLDSVINPVREKFLVGSDYITAFRYLGLNIQQLDDHSILIDQISYINMIKEIDVKKERKAMKDTPLNNIERKKLKTLIGQLSWAAGQTRPDLEFDLCDLSSCVKNPTMLDLITANKVLAKAKAEPVVLNFKDLGDPNKIKIVAYNDSSFGNLKDGGSQGGFVIYVMNSTGHCSPIMWQSKKVRRVVKSAMAAETLVQVDSAEASLWIAFLLKEILGAKVSTKIECYTDSHQLYDAVHSIKSIQDKRLRIDVAILREMIERKEVTVEWVTSSEQIADCLTKHGASATKLLATIAAGII